MFIDALAGVSFLYFISFVLKLKLSIWIVVLGPLIPYWPDLDYFVEKVQNGTVCEEKRGFHRTWTHFPLTNSFLILIFHLIFRSGSATLFVGICAFWHILHDSADRYSFGVPWLGPFSLRYYKFYHQGRWLISWSAQEVDQLLAEKKEENRGWLWKQYIKFSFGNFFQFVFALPLYVLSFYL